MFKIYTNRINGKTYEYIYDTIYIDSGKTIRKSTSLGIKSGSTKREEAIQKFINTIIKEEADARASYWSEKTSSAFRQYASIEKLENKRTKLFRGTEYADRTLQNKISERYVSDFIYNSNRIEGSKVTSKQVYQQIHTNDLRRNEEVGNMVRAMDFVEDSFKWNIKTITKLHAIMLAHEPAKHGLKREDNIAVNSPTTSWKEVRPELEKLLLWMKSAKKRIYPPELAFEFYYRFERIHPFEDGNGRVGRLLMNQILENQKYFPIIIWNDNAVGHTTAFTKHMEGMSDRYYKFMSQQMVKTYDTYLQLL